MQQTGSGLGCALVGKYRLAGEGARRGVMPPAAAARPGAWQAGGVIWPRAELSPAAPGGGCFEEAAGSQALGPARPPSLAVVLPAVL